MSEDQYRRIRDRTATLQDDLLREEEEFEQQARRVMQQMRMDFEARTADKRDRVEDAQEELATFERRAKRALRSGLRKIYTSRDMDDAAKEQAAEELQHKFRTALRPDDRLHRQQQERIRAMMPPGLVQMLGGGGGMRMILN